jgi:multiple sugar transport system permease protein
VIATRARVRRHSRRPLNVAQTTLLVLIALFALFPIYWMVVSSLKSNIELQTGNPALIPDLRALHFENYVDMWRHLHFADYLRNSLIVCTAATVVAVGVAALAGFSLATFRFHGARVFSVAVTATQMLPGIMFLLPLYLGFRQLNDIAGVQLIDTYQGLVLLYVAFFVPMSLWILRSYFAAIPRELLEAGLMDGCSVMGAFRRILLPLAWPGLVATAVYVFLSCWDELLFASVMMNSAATQTVPVGIRSYIGQFQNRYDLLMAAATVTCLPPAIAFFFFQRRMVSGLTAGAVK